MKYFKLSLILLFLVIFMVGCSNVKIIGKNTFKREIITETEEEVIEEEEKEIEKQITTQTETIKIGNTFVLIDVNLDKKEILDYIKKFDLIELKRIEIRNNWKINDGWYLPYIIYVFNMKYGLQKDENWKYTFRHEYSHHYCYINFNDLSEECANKYQVRW